MSFIVCWLALTLNIYTEAGGEGKGGMQRVADTVITRTQHKDYPDNVCKVVLQPNQFSWTKRLKSKDYNGLVRYQKRVLKVRNFSDKERAAYMQASVLAYKALQPGYKPKYRFIHFYSGKDRPKWAKGKKAVRYRNHYFMRE